MSGLSLCSLRKILLWTGMTSIPNFSTRHNDGMLLSYLLWDRVGCVVEGALQQRQASASASASAYPLSLREVLESIQIIQGIVLFFSCFLMFVVVFDIEYGLIIAAHDFSAVQVIHNQCLSMCEMNLCLSLLFLTHGGLLCRLASEKWNTETRNLLSRAPSSKRA